MFQRIATVCLASFGLLLFVASAGAVPASTGASPDTGMTLQKAVAGPWRSTADKARDRYRHPVQTLQFFGIRPDMTVVELDPGGGWYSQILGPFLAGHGHLVEAGSPAFAHTLAAHPQLYGHTATVVPFAPPLQLKLGAPGSADMVLTFRNTHDWLNHSPATLAGVFDSAFAVLRHGGVFGVVEHRARPFADATQSAKTLHRIPEDYLIAAGLKAGFRLDGVSEINANPKDPEDINVHRLPPDLAGPAAEHARLQAVGESDRMTLRFVKP